MTILFPHSRRTLGPRSYGANAGCFTIGPPAYAGEAKEVERVVEWSGAPAKTWAPASAGDAGL